MDDEPNIKIVTKIKTKDVSGQRAEDIRFTIMSALVDYLDDEDEHESVVTIIQ